MKRQQPSILSYFFSVFPAGILKVLLIIGGISLGLTGWIVDIRENILFFPQYIWVTLAIFGIILGILGYIVPHISRHIYDYTFVFLILLYLSAIYLAYLNKLPSMFVPVLIALQILVGITFRSTWEYVIFAVASIFLFCIPIFSIEQPETPVIPFAIIMGSVTVFTGLYILVQTSFTDRIRGSSHMLEHILDNALFAIFLIDTRTGSLIYQNRIGARFLQDYLPPEIDNRLQWQGLTAALALPADPARLIQQAGSPADKQLIRLVDQHGRLNEIELYLSQPEGLRKDLILIKIHDVTLEREQARNLSRSMSVTQSLVNALPDILLIIQPDQSVRVIRTIPEIDAYFSLKKFEGRPYQELTRQVMSASKQKELSETLDQLRQSHQPMQMEFITRMRGELMYFDLRLLNMRTSGEILAIIRDISQARTTALALKTIEQNYREIFNSGADGILILEPDTLRTVDVSQVAADMLQAGKDDLLREGLAAFCPPGELAVLQTLLRSALEGRPIRQEFNLIMTSGEMFPAEIIAKQAMLGGQIKLMVIVRDIRNRKAAESRMRLFRELLNRTRDGIMVLDPDSGQIIDCNEAVAASLGYSQEETLQLTVYDISYDSGQAQQLDTILKNVKQYGAQTYQGNHLHRDGHIFPVEVSMGYATLEGRPYLIGVARDISERLEQENALRQSELRYRTLVERMNEGLILTDKEELILFVNDRVCQIMGQPRENLMGRYSYEALQGEKVEEIIREKTQLRLDGISDQYELKLNHPRGKPIYVLVAGAPYIDALGDTVGTIAIITDITDRKLTEIKLQEKNDELDAFVYKASHDLRGPLASIIGLTNIVQDEVSDQTALRYFSLIARSTKRLDNILSELLDVTRINKAPLKLEWVNLQELVVDIYASLQHQQGGTEVARLYDITTTDWVSDKKLLTSILQNLIVNSVNYHNPQTQTPYVIVKVRKAQQAIQIEVNDNGMGIPPKMKNKVFEMFFRGSNQSKGSGLGLYIVKNAVEKLQGAITVESEERIGSTFTITLPDLSDEMPAA